MRALGEYIVSISAAAFLCGIVNSLAPKGAAKEIIKLVGGLFLVFTVIRPIADIKIPDLIAVGRSFQEEAEAAAQAGAEMAQTETVLGISEQLEAYILDKAGELGLTLEAEVELDKDGSFLPEKICLTGDASPLARKEMMAFLQRDLGVTEEEIQWSQQRSGSK